MALDITALAVGVTVALGVGILLLLLVIAAYYTASQRVDQLRDQLITGGTKGKVDKVQRRKGKKKIKKQKQKTEDPKPKERRRDDIVEVLRDRRRQQAQAQNEVITGTMRGYPGHMYIPGQSAAAPEEGLMPVYPAEPYMVPRELQAEMEDMAYRDEDRRSDYSSQYERRIVPPRLSRQREETESDEDSSDEDSSTEDSSTEDDSSSDDGRRQQHRYPPGTMPVVVLPPPLPAPRPTPTTTTTAQIHTSPPAVVQPQQPAVFPSPVQPVSHAPAIYSATHGGITMATAGPQYEEQETVALTAEGLESFQSTPAAAQPWPSTGHGMTTTAVAMVGSRPPPPTSTVQPVAPSYGMSTTAVAMVGARPGTDPRSNQQHPVNQNAQPPLHVQPLHHADDNEASIEFFD